MGLLDIHRITLEQWRRAMNLVGPGPLEPHYLDCEQALQGLEPTGRWADLGSGAGFPGIVFAHLFPQVQLDLVDSRRKRCSFLEHVLAQAAVPRDQARVLCQRVEELEGPYDGLVSRAFAPPLEVLAHAARLTEPGGRVVLFLGDEEPPAVDGWTWESQRRYAVETDGPRWRRVAVGRRR
jgi:16S rRNA (guanine(527)-N(7))-methyltransferase RsmG